MNKVVRLAVMADLPGIMVCINDAKLLLKKSGSVQWNGKNNYPSEADMENDIRLKRGYVCEIDGEIAGVAVFSGIEPTYSHPVGKWLVDTDNYLTIHRIAVNGMFRRKGVATSLMTYAEKVAKERGIISIRIDTHEKNSNLQALVNKMGYTYCGYVIYSHIAEDPKRLIYEKRIE